MQVVETLEVDIPTITSGIIDGSILLLVTDVGEAPGTYYVYDGTNVRPLSTPQSITIACGTETAIISAGTSKVTFHSPTDFTIIDVFAGLNVAQTSGSIFTVDINNNGVSILSTLITIDNTEETSLTANAPAVVSSPQIVKGDKITIDVDQIGDGTAVGLKVYINGYST